MCFRTGGSNSASLVQTFKSIACRLLFITGKNAQRMVIVAVSVVDLIKTTVECTYGFKSTTNKAWLMCCIY